jgi:hypothetical protein
VRESARRVRTAGVAARIGKKIASAHSQRLAPGGDVLSRAARAVARHACRVRRNQKERVPDWRFAKKTWIETYSPARSGGLQCDAIRRIFAAIARVSSGARAKNFRR